MFQSLSKYQSIGLVVSLVIPCTAVFSQSMTNPYSVYGLGDLEHRTYNMNAGMGYTGIGMKTSVFTSGNNPASVAGIEKSFFIVNASTAGRFVGYHGTGVTLDNSRNQDFTIKKLSLSSKMTNFWGASIGMQQFSNVSYQFNANKAVGGSTKTYNITYSGDGGLNEYFFNNGFSIGKRIMLGVTGSIIAGPDNQTEIITNDDGSTIESLRTDYYSGGKLEYGAIYSGQLSKKWQVSLGAKYAKKTKLNFERSLSVTDNATSVVSDELIEQHTTSLPQTAGVGFSLAHSNGITISGDYSYENWSALNIAGSGWALTNSNRVSAGIEFASFKKAPLGGYQRHTVQFGGFMQNSYLVVNNQQIKEWGITAGATKLMRGGLMIGASLEAGVRGTTVSNLIKENFFQFTLSFSYRDFINSKGYKYR